MPSLHVQEVQRRCGQEAAVNQFFSDLESLEFPDATLRELYPDLAEHWEVVGKLQSVPWQWVCSVELSLAGFLAPTACLYPVQSIAIYALTWVFLLHPGSTQTSGLLRLYQDCLDEIERAVNLDRAEAATEWRASRPNPGPNEKNPYEGRVNFSLGSGSLEGEGKVASQTCNLGRACAFLTEGKRWFNWLSAEGTLNETIVTELFERAKWRRVTLDGTRSFTIMFPFFALSGAVHLPDVAFMFAGDDPLGIRGRARFMYTRQVTLATLAVAFLACLFPLLHAACRLCDRPSFKRAADLREANRQHNADRQFLSHLVQRFRPIHAAHSPDFLPREVFEFVKGYPMRPYDLESDEAQAIFDRTFDHHVEAQERHYLSEHSLAKLHGKKKTSNLRFALQVHLLDQARRGHAGDGWACSLPARALTFANAYGDYLDRVGDCMEAFFASMVADVAPPAAGSASTLAKFRALAETSLQQFCDMAVEQRRLLLGLLKVVLTHASAWVTGSSLRTDREFKNLLEQQAVPRESWDDKICQVGALLRGTRLDNFFLSTNASGPRSFYYIRRNLLAAEPYYMGYINVLQALGLAVGSLKGHSLDRLRQQKPKTAPEPQFLVYTSREEAVQVLDAIRNIARDVAGP